MFFDLKTPWRAEASADPADGFRILDVEGVHVLTAPNSQAGSCDPVLLRAGRDLAAPLAAIAIAAPELLRAAMLILAASRSVPPGAQLERLVLTGATYDQLRQAVALALRPVDVPPAPAASDNVHQLRAVR
ncbi:hypothetical protein [Brevundimonas diminuta]|uniref:hypothetical protein n=1 Tax=Brevundimonas diminuta TaxID=293 RepID=UPI003D9A5D25